MNRLENAVKFTSKMNLRRERGAAKSGFVYLIQCHDFVKILSHSLPGGRQNLSPMKTKTVPTQCTPTPRAAQATLGETPCP